MEPPSRASTLIDRCGRRPLSALDDAYWQSFVDELARSGKSYSRISTYLAVTRHIYVYAQRANRRLVPTDPTRELAMPANDGRPRERVATKEEAAQLVDAIPSVDVRECPELGRSTQIRRFKFQRRRARPTLWRQRRADRKGPSARALQDPRKLPRPRVKRPSGMGDRLLHRHASQRDRQGRVASRLLGRR